MDYKEQKIKEFGDLFDNNFLQWDLTDKLGMKERAEAFFYKTLEEQEEEIEFRQKAIDKLIDRVKSFRLSEETIKSVLRDYFKEDNTIFQSGKNNEEIINDLAKIICKPQGKPNE